MGCPAPPLTAGVQRVWGPVLSGVPPPRPPFCCTPTCCRFVDPPFCCAMGRYHFGTTPSLPARPSARLFLMGSPVSGTGRSSLLAFPRVSGLLEESLMERPPHPPLNPHRMVPPSGPPLPIATPLRSGALAITNENRALRKYIPRRKRLGRTRRCCYGDSPEVKRRSRKWRRRGHGLLEEAPGSQRG